MVNAPGHEMPYAGLRRAEIRACEAQRLCALLSATRDFCDCDARAASTLRNVQVGYGPLGVFPFFDGGFVEPPRAADAKSGNTSLPKQAIDSGGVNPQMPRQFGDRQYVTLSIHRVSLPRADRASDMTQAPPPTEDGTKIPVRSELCQERIRGVKRRAGGITREWVTFSRQTQKKLRANPAKAPQLTVHVGEQIYGL